MNLGVQKRDNFGVINELRFFGLIVLYNNCAIVREPFLLKGVVSNQKFFEKDFTIKVNVKKKRFDRSTVILKLKSEKFLNALKYIQTITKMLIRY